MNEVYFDIRKHLEERHLVSEQGVLSIMDDAVFFAIYSYNGNLVGYQIYRPLISNKKNKNDPKDGRYYTYITKGRMGVWGLHSLENQKYFCITEGIFDATRLHKAGIPAVATLANDPKKMRNQFNLMPHFKIAVCDDDEAGFKLSKYGDAFIRLPNGKDVGDLNENEFLKLEEKIDKLKAKNLRSSS